MTISAEYKEPAMNQSTAVQQVVRIDVDEHRAMLAEPLERSVGEVFETMLMLPVTVEAPLRQRLETFEDSVSGMIGLSGERRGMLAVHAPSPVARELTAALLGEEVAEVNEDVKDAIGELVNMIAGGVKTYFLAQGASYDLSVPTVCAGQSYHVNLLSRTEGLVLPFQCDAGRFLVEFKLVQGDIG